MGGGASCGWLVVDGQLWMASCGWASCGWPVVDGQLWMASYGGLSVDG